MAYKETFVSPFEKNTKEEALKVLEDIRRAHPASSGWKELEGRVDRLPNGKYRAVRVHQKSEKTVDRDER